ncbi:MAG: serine/threonine protein kinase [Candidatus Delongbacteria bacterium]|nr:serine/threonine protein kinase [Candidatus Delongbacteria bacterium]
MKKSIGKYPIEAELGSGGMGKIYRARHPSLNKPLAIKELTIPDDPQFQHRFQRESEILFDFSHPHIIKYMDSGQDKKRGLFFLVMEYIDGLSLDKLIREKGYIRPDIAILIAAMVCDGLHYAHDHRIIHRDVKSSNIFIAYDGSVKIGDFGISGFSETRSTALTLTGQLIGTPAYMPPELFNQDVQLNAPSPTMDIYSMGVVIYEMLLGHNPFEQPTLAGTIRQVVTNSYSSFDNLPQTTPPCIQSIIRKCLRANPQERYQTARELKLDLLKTIDLPSEQLDDRRISLQLQDYLAGRIEPETRINWPTRQPSTARRKTTVLVLITVLFVLIIMVLSLRLLRPDSRSGPDQSPQSADTLLSPNDTIGRDSSYPVVIAIDSSFSATSEKTMPVQPSSQGLSKSIGKTQPTTDSLSLESVVKKYQRYVRFKIRMEHPIDRLPKPPVKKKPRRPEFEPARVVSVFYHDQNATREEHLVLDTPVREHDHTYFISSNIPFTSDTIFVRFQSNQWYHPQSNAYYFPLKEQQDTTILVVMKLNLPRPPH